MQFRQLLPALATLLAGGVAASAQDSFIYAFNEEGKVSANGYPLDDLPDGSSSSQDELWRDIFVRGPDRWMIRGDGKIVENGEDVTNLSGDTGWRGLVLDDAGNWYAMSAGGKITTELGGAVANYTTSSDAKFVDIETDGQSVFVLKQNGAVYRVPEDGPLFKFDASGEDGDAPDKLWVRIQFHPTDGRLWGLRQDGKVMSTVVPVTPPDPIGVGDLEGNLPFDDDADFLGNELYYDFTFAPDGTWFALRADGKLYSVTDQSEPIINFPGAPDSGPNQTYVSVVERSGQVFVLRKDGNIYESSSTEEVIDLKDNDYVFLALGSELPNLVNVKNQAPTGTSMTVVAPEGADIALQVVATDRDLASEDLVLAVDPSTPLPTGATWDEGTRTIVWPDAGPVGKYTVKITVSDGIAKPVKTTQKITIKALDVNEAKNAKPVFVKISKAVALVAVDYALPIFAYDLDGTAPELSLDPSKPVPAAAAFDAMTGILSWNAPTAAETGTTSFKFLATDGTATTKGTIKIKVQTSLLGF